MRIADVPSIVQYDPYENTKSTIVTLHHNAETESPSSLRIPFDHLSTIVSFVELLRFDAVEKKTRNVERKQQ